MINGTGLWYMGSLVVHTLELGALQTNCYIIADPESRKAVVIRRPPPSTDSCPDTAHPMNARELNFVTECASRFLVSNSR